jgi:hypothetical protein
MAAADRFVLPPVKIETWRRLAALASLIAIGYLLGMGAADQYLHGGITAFSVIASTCVFGCVERCDRERGIWMLSALILVLGGGFALLFTYATIADMIRPSLRSWPMFFDSFAALVIWLLTLWAVASAGVLNWRLYRRGPDGACGGGSPPRRPREPGPVPVPLLPKPPSLGAHAELLPAVTLHV